MAVREAEASRTLVPPEAASQTLRQEAPPASRCRLAGAAAGPLEPSILLLCRQPLPTRLPCLWSRAADGQAMRPVQRCGRSGAALIPRPSHPALPTGLRCGRSRGAAGPALPLIQSSSCPALLTRMRCGGSRAAAQSALPQARGGLSGLLLEHGLGSSVGCRPGDCGMRRHFRLPLPPSNAQSPAPRGQRLRNGHKYR